MEYTYTLDEKNDVKIIWAMGTLSQSNNPETRTPFTKEEAESWAVNMIEKIKNNNHKLSPSLFVKKVNSEIPNN